jgi:hypothetical protein
MILSLITSRTQLGVRSQPSDVQQRYPAGLVVESRD